MKKHKKVVLSVYIYYEINRVTTMLGIWGGFLFGHRQRTPHRIGGHITLRDLPLFPNRLNKLAIQLPEEEHFGLEHYQEYDRFGDYWALLRLVD